MNRNFSRHLAFGAAAAMLTLPAFAHEQSASERGWLVPLLPAPTSMTDMINGNDFRDNRDSTISRNDVPVDQTTLPQADAAQWRSSETPVEPGVAEPERMSDSASHSSALPAGSGTVAADEPMPGVDELAQQNETIVNTAPEPSLAAEHELGSGIGASNVTARNPSGIETVHDRTRTEVSTGQPGAGGSDDLAAGMDADMLNAQ